MRFILSCFLAFLTLVTGCGQATIHDQDPFQQFVELVIISNDYTAIDGTVVISAREEDSCTLRFVPANLESLELDESDLRYEWYKEGVRIDGAIKRDMEVTTPFAGSFRYDLFVTTKGETNLGSSSMLLKVKVP